MHTCLDTLGNPLRFLLTEGLRRGSKRLLIEIQNIFQARHTIRSSLRNASHLLLPEHKFFLLSVSRTVSCETVFIAPSCLLTGTIANVHVLLALPYRRSRSRWLLCQHKNRASQPRLAPPGSGGAMTFGKLQTNSTIRLPANQLIQLLQQFLGTCCSVVDKTRLAAAIQQKSGRHAEHTPAACQLGLPGRVHFDHL